MNYLEKRKKIELEETSLNSLEGDMSGVLESIGDQYYHFLNRVSEQWDCDVFVLFEERIPYYSDIETPHMVAYRWETEGEFKLRIEEDDRKANKKRDKELKLLAELKAKYEV